MKLFRAIVFPVALGVLVLAPTALTAADVKRDQKNTAAVVINKLSWLAGSWRMERNGRIIDEQWMAPAAGVMLGMGRTISKGRVVEHEFMQIREGPGGMLFFVAQPSGQKEATFQVGSLSEMAVTFENPQHDFPQKITYALQADGNLLAVVEGVDSNGKTRRIDFLYKRP
jgi:hypothetical protein